MQAPRRGSCAARKATRQPSCITNRQTCRRITRTWCVRYRSQFQLTSVQISQISCTPDKDYYNGRGWFIRTWSIFTCSYRSLIYIRCPQLWNRHRGSTPSNFTHFRGPLVYFTYASFVSAVAVAARWWIEGGVMTRLFLGELLLRVAAR